MAAGDTMRGRRLPDRAGFKLDGLERGDYVKVMYDGRSEWYCLAPAIGGGAVGNLNNHDITEHEDGTITVSPSILIHGQDGWHGYLTKGTWREV